MRILHINCNYSGNRLHKLMVEKLDKLGYDNQVYAATAEKKKAAQKTNSNAIISLCLNKYDRFWFGHKQRKIIKDLSSKIDVASFDCIHAYTLFSDGNAAMHFSKKHNIPYVVAVRNTDVNTFFKYMIHLRGRGIKILRNASKIFFLSDTYCRNVFDKYIPKKYHTELLAKAEIIANGVDDYWLEHTLDKPKILELDKSIHLMFAGRIDRNKNIPTTQKAVKILKEKGYDVHFTVIGRVDERREFKRIIKDSNTTVIDAVPKEKLIDSYRNAHIFVMPSFTESFGLVYVEAMSQGLPVIYTEGQGFDNQFPEGVVGYHVSANDPSCVAEGIERIIKRFDEMAKNTVAASKQFNWDAIIAKYDAIYKTIFEESGD